MAIDTVTQHPQSQDGRTRSDRRDASQHPSRARSLAGALLAICLFAVLAAGAALVPGASSSPQIGPKQIHTITRGDMVVTVTEQGTLESSDNTEIKCKVRGDNTVIWVVESGTEVQQGDELVRLDTLFIEEQISERTKFAHLARSQSERSKADVARAELAILEYEEGRFVSELATLEKDLAIFESNLRTSQNMLHHAEMMSDSGYVSELEVEEKEFAVTRAKLDVEVKNTEIDVLKRFTKAMELETLKGDLNAARARHEADKERAFADALRRDRALEEFNYCVINAERSGMVIHPLAAAWKNAPEIEEGSTVHNDQVLLLMPDLSKMQVKVGVHESVVERIEPGLVAKISLPEKTLYGEVSAVASIAQPAGWWTGNVVKYDTIIQLPTVEGLKPGMTAEVEVIMARHEDVLIVPVTAVVETEEGYFCWARTTNGVQRRPLQLGDNSDMFIVVEAGLTEGDEVVLNPLAFIEEAQTEAAKTLHLAQSWQQDSSETNHGD
jgi:multidrug efflux pump subunit AcrA (membrane-fusion protein)